MQFDVIEAVGIDPNGSFWVRPSKTMFPMIYREAREVQWDLAQRRLYTPKPREWTYADWFRHVLSSVKEQGTDLRLTSETEWVGIDSALRQKIEAG